MPTKLYVVHGSHPCATVAKALEIKGVPYRTIELPPPGHVLAMKLLFGQRTVPAIRFDDGEKLSGSRAILARLEERVPAPALLPGDAAAAAAVLEAERWGDEVFQPLGRTILWPTMKAHPEAGPTYTAGGKLQLPAAMVRASMPLIARLECAINATSEDVRARDLAALPEHLDRIDGWIADGTLGATPVPNRADLQIAPTLALLMTMADLRAIIAPRPAGQLADRLFHANGLLPLGSIPDAALPRVQAVATAAG